jgi:putative transposase
MPGPQPPPIELTERQRTILERIERRQTSPQRLVRRAGIVLAAAEGANNEQIAKRQGLTRGTARTWRGRWLAASAVLETAEAEGISDKELTEFIESILADEPRPGAPGVFTPEQLAQIMALACEDPQASGRPVSHWTPRELADEAVKRRIVERISPRSVGRFLKGRGLEASLEPILAQRQPR